ncbi:AdoMet-dependent rRNA methyltransferase spb1 [Lodderomyces elongisporus]|uniref:AdoMet-dependent rRNA methyltransferase spb1 n=1 Tax=Lodderomyces elongisporus TaxID=36914 RepID=UPI0029234FCD|nr:AdoMet-dependent rRNA methyltransferase spb1 [Lodderomyces elongisporus]WLF81931.1 AdoMet-dependent rRNA methyltransferase spb1 [Lodderomyces elongisporus]
MGKTQKKNSKGRLDRYYYLAKEKGYRARSSFKIIQINEKFGHFLEKSKVVIDLCAAPGSWCQVASQLCPINSLIIGVDIVPIKPLPNCITFQSDITTEDCRSKLRGHMKTWKADTVLHDGAPNVGLGWVQDAFTQSQLTLQALKLAVENLTAGGTFVTKVFRSRDYNNLMWVFQQLFEKVEATKPPSSRNVSAEIFVVCKGFKAPKKLDPRLLDPREVFEELNNDKKNANNEEKIFNPEKKRRQRQGYEEGDYTLFHTMPIMQFIKEEDPINQLGDLNKFEIDEDDHEWKIVKKLKTYTEELKECFKDLKVLGRKEFKMILRFRKQARDLLGIDKVEEAPEIEVEELTEEQKIDKELNEMMERQKQKAKRAKKTANEIKQKEIVRNQMQMVTDMNIGIDAAQIGAESLFNLKTAEKSGQLSKLAAGKKAMVFNDEDIAKDTEIHIDEDAEAEDGDSADEVDELEGQLDGMYQQYQERRAERDANYRAKMSRGEDAEAWDGIAEDDDDEQDRSDYDMDSDEESDSDDDEHIKLIASGKKSENGLTRSARSFFASDSIFNELNDDDLIAESAPKESKMAGVKTTAGQNESSPAQPQQEPTPESESESELDSDSDSDFEVVPADNDLVDGAEEEDFSSDDETPQSHQSRVDLDTAEAMTLAHQIALGQKNKKDLIEEGINRYSFRDKDGLPEWFLDDEKKHSKLVKPITKEAALAIKEKQKQLNARPIKKVLEAKGRKKMRALRRLEKMKKKSDLINEDSSKSEYDKAAEISKLMQKAKNSGKDKQRKKLTVVVARGSNRGLSGRPKGIKGKYKMVDGVMKNEQRALRRIAKKHKK